MVDRGPMRAVLAPAVLLFFLAGPQGGYTQRRAPLNSQCDESSCYPATGDLLVGREDRLKASSTCGLQVTERYCIVSHLEDEANKCFVCDSRRPYHVTNKMSHRVENIVSTFRRDWKLRWWQAQNGIQEASIQLDLEAEFHFTHLIMRFKTFRPAAMLIERSYDFGKSWKVYRYYAYDCAESFPRVSTAPITRIQDVICESKYSDVAPSTEGEVIFRVLPSNVEIRDPYSEEVQDLLKMTNLRVNLTKLHTLGDNLLDSREQIKEKYYYSMYSMVVRGSCSCYGHASRCLPLTGQGSIPGMVYGRCECKHNTKGLNCEQCDDFYNDLPWRPARGRETSACKMCECNQHATRCHFDPAVYEATGRVSGGVCDDCQHNTMGHHCEECKPFFYQDPGRPITDPYVCRSCNCDPVGSEHGGECEGRSDHSLGLVAGRCSCKRYVEGHRCDTCMPRFWNMRAENPDGCEPCACDSSGTASDSGCEQTSGECRCKRYVVGRQCNACLEGYWGLSDHNPQGCLPCGCDVGGAFDLNCHQRTGHCHCRPNIEGQRCDQIQHGYFVTTLDWQRYEAEDARGTGNTQEVVREVIPGRPSSWTGRGFMRVFEGSSLEFIVDDIPFSMEYDFVIRYEPQMPQGWDDVSMEIVRPGQVDYTGACANLIPQDDRKKFNLNTGARQYIVHPGACLEKGVHYIVRLRFNRYRSNRRTPDANILVDSIVLMPSIDGHPLMQPGNPNSIRAEFERYRCRDHYLSATHTPLSDVCRKLIFSSSASIYNGALACECSPLGSESSVCDQYGGQCRCKPNVVGRKCDKCAAGYFGFGPSGCTSCNCNPVGSRGTTCDPITGQCSCHPGTYGQKCGQCERGHFGFPNCRPCQCSGLADECDSDTGMCLNCRDFTGGSSCERCADGYYADPRPGGRCQPCLCPGGHGSGMQHADTCHLDTRSNVPRVICDCRRGYAGASCNRCADNFFGNPNVPGGTCEPCNCNNNIDFGLPGSCDPVTGQCLKCLYNTEGAQCERCKPNFYGDARRQNCKQCVCSILGTHRTSSRTCHPVTGQCECLPHVTGLECSSCEPNYWKLASGQGCEPCGCDRTGSVSAHCNEFDGQCQCLPGRGGRDCSSCEDLFWGDPRSRCYPCSCDPRGSASLQCNRETGRCECAPGVAGERCDHCARGTTGALPHCVPCGECYDNWDQIINELKIETNVLIKEGSEIKHGGVSGAFEEDFQEMERKLEEVKRILAGADTSIEGLDEIKRKIQIFKQNLTYSTSQIRDLDNQNRDASNRIESINNRIELLKHRIDVLTRNANYLKDNATKIQELDVTGAFNSVRESHNRSSIAQRTVDSTTSVVRRSDAVRNQADEIIRIRKAEFDRQVDANDMSIRDVNITITSVSRSIVDLNKIVCDGHGDPCDSMCGGAGCGKCGGISCSMGSVSKASNAMDLSRRADLLVQEKYTETRDALSQIEQAKDLCTMATSDAQMTYDRAQLAKNESEGSLSELRSLIQTISEFLTQDRAKFGEVRDVSEEVLRMSISLTPGEILDLDRQIKDAISGLTNIDAILKATYNATLVVRELERKANNARLSADDVLDTAKRIRDLLNEARDSQGAAETAITDTQNQIEDAKAGVTEIESRVYQVDITSNRTHTRAVDLRERITALRRKFNENQINVDRALRAASESEALANEADASAMQLDTRYSDASRQLENKVDETRSAKDRAERLKIRATEMFTSIKHKYMTLEAWQTVFLSQEEHLSELLLRIAIENGDMVLLLTDIREAANYLRTCGTA